MKTILLFATRLLLTATPVMAEVPLREHPRPDFKRPAWVNLNGPWRFEFDPNDNGEKERWFEPGSHQFSRRITVPFPWESRLSGIGDTEYKGVAWYAREVKLPAGGPWKGRDPWLIVGACDWQAKVWVNGQPACEHVGGYTPFDVNLARFAEPGQTITITIRAVDTTSDQQPTGKQVGWYTRTSGVWQTVYLEPRATSFMRAIQAWPSISQQTISYTVQVQQPTAVRKIQIRSPQDEFQTAYVEFSRPGHSLPRVTTAINKVEPWSPESPKLYPVRLELFGFEGELLDRVDSYFGLREVSARPAPGRDYQYIYLNNRPIYLRGALHQSFHPEGIYQYPCDAAIRGDYELCKRIGINFLRIHIKAPIPRELYWADKLGVLIMQDMPNFWQHTDQARRWYEQMLPAVIERDFNHPAIFAWVDFNETWGLNRPGSYDAARQEWVEGIYRKTRQLDPTRLVEDNSPCRYDHVVTDINSWHFYINDYAAARDHIRNVVEKTHPGSTFNYIGGRKQGGEPLMNSEYGGISAGLGDQDISWCFKYLTNELRLHDKICGYIYTELSDIEWEHNGYVNYDRTPKQYGYEFWHPEFSLADINSPDFVVIDAPPMIVLKPGERREVPVKISHFSDRPGRGLSLHYRLDWIDGLGRRHAGQWRSRPADWEPFKVLDQPAVTVAAAQAGKGAVGALLVEVHDAEGVAARNYVNVLVDCGPLPRVQSLDGRTVALRFSPMDFAGYRFDDQPAGRQGYCADKVSGTGRGAVEYHLRLPDGLPVDQLGGLTVLAELAGKAGGQKLDWPERKKPVDYPQTDVKTWPSNVSIYANDEKIGVVLLGDDPADARGALSHYRGYQGSYGYLVRPSVSGPALEPLRQSLEQDRTLRIRFEVPADAEHPGGLAVFGQNAGCYPVEPTVLLAFKENHGLGAGFKSDEPVATDIAVRILLPTAETAPQTWRYTTDKPQGAWTDSDFDDAGWKTGEAGFGSRGTPGAINHTRWNTPEIWLRRTVELSGPMSAGQWRIHHDEDLDVYVNGIRVLSLPGFASQYQDVPLERKALQAFHPGRNVVAVHCRQTAGGQYVDVGLTAINPQGR